MRSSSSVAVTNPEISFGDNTAIGPVQKDNIIINATDVNLGAMTYAYTDNVCNGTLNFSNQFSSGVKFSIDIEDYNNKYILTFYPLVLYFTKNMDFWNEMVL